MKVHIFGSGSFFTTNGPDRLSESSGLLHLFSRISLIIWIFGRDGDLKMLVLLVGLLVLDVVTRIVVARVNLLLRGSPPSHTSVIKLSGC